MPRSDKPDEHWYQRVDLIMSHLPRYWIDGVSVLARDAKVSRATIHNILNNEHAPTHRVAVKVTEALRKALGRRRLNSDEVFSFTGSFPTQICKLCRCSGCLPEAAYLPDGSRHPDYRHLKGGDWEVPTVHSSANSPRNA